MAYNLIRGNIKHPDSEGSSILTDGSLELWDDANTLTNWDKFIAGPDAGTGNITQESTIVKVGTYSVKMDFDGDSKGYGIAQKNTGLTPDDDYIFEWYARDDGSGYTSSVLIFNGIFGDDATQVWDPTEETWENVGGDPSGYIVSIECSATWESDSIDVVVPANGVITPHIFSNDSSSTVYLDDLSLKKVTAADNKTIWDFKNSTDPDDFDEDNDTIIKFSRTGGGGDIVLELDSSGWSSDYSPSIAPLAAKTGMKLLGTVTINPKEETATKIFDGEENLYAIPLHIEVETLLATALNGDATITIGNNATDYNNVISGLAYSTTQGLLQAATLTNAHGKGNLSDNMYVNVTSAETGTSGTIKIYYYGILQG